MGDQDLQLEAGPFEPGTVVTGRVRTRDPGPVSVLVQVSQASHVPGERSKRYDWRHSPGRTITELDYRYTHFERHLQLPLGAAAGDWREFALPLPSDAPPSVSTARAEIQLVARFEIDGRTEKVTIQIASPQGAGEPAAGFPPVASETREGWNTGVRQQVLLVATPGQVPRGGALQMGWEDAPVRGLRRLAQRVAGVREIVLQCEEETALGNGADSMFFASPDYGRQIVVDERAPIGPHGNVELTVPRDAPYSFPGEIVAWRWRAAALGPGGVVLGATPVTVTTGVV